MASNVMRDEAQFGYRSLNASTRAISGVAKANAWKRGMDARGQPVERIRSAMGWRGQVDAGVNEIRLNMHWH
eukprot:6186294-Pleurochrysis_carterae.AAC.5